MTEQEYRDQIYKKAAAVQTRTDFDQLLNEIIGYAHDYGTIVYGVMAAMKGAFNVINRSPNGGITGFQAGCVGWECIKEFMSVSGPARIQDFDNLLYPQYADRFDKVISSDTWDHVKKKAQEQLDKSLNESVHPRVLEHWKSIVNGQIPFGFEVKEAP